jgi:hypothetical protein
MVSKITMHKIENTIAAGVTSGTSFSKAIRGKILSVKIEYSNTTPASTSDRDVNIFEMNPAAPTTVAKALQEVLNIGTLGAVPVDDNNVYYPKVAGQDNTGTSLKFLSTDAAIVPTDYVVFGRLMLAVTAAVAGDITTAYIMVEEY